MLNFILHLKFSIYNINNETHNCVIKQWRA